MQPQQQPHNPYDFIVNPAKPPKQSFMAGKSFGLKIGLLCGGALVLIIFMSILFSTAFKNEGNVPYLTSVAQDQSEIVRVSTMGNTQAVSSDTRGFAQTLSLTVGTDEQQLLTFLTTNGVKLSGKTLGLGTKATTDQALQAATQSSNYDQTFENIMQSYLSDYANDLKAAFGNTKVAKEKQLLSSQYQNSQLLIQQLQSLQNNTDNN